MREYTPHGQRWCGLGGKCRKTCVERVLDDCGAMVSVGGRHMRKPHMPKRNGNRRRQANDSRWCRRRLSPLSKAEVLTRLSDYNTQPSYQANSMECPARQLPAKCTALMYIGDT